MFALLAEDAKGQPRRSRKSVQEFDEHQLVDLEEALDTLLLRWSQALQDSGQQTLLREAAKQRDAAPKALAMRAVMRAELTNAKAAAVMLGAPVRALFLLRGSDAMLRQHLPLRNE